MNSPEGLDACFAGDPRMRGFKIRTSVLDCWSWITRTIKPLESEEVPLALGSGRVLAIASRPRLRSGARRAKHQPPWRGYRAGERRRARCTRRLSAGRPRRDLVLRRSHPRTSTPARNSLRASRRSNRITPSEAHTKRRSDDIAHREDVHPSWPIHPASTPEELARYPLIRQKTVGSVRPGLPPKTKRCASAHGNTSPQRRAHSDWLLERSTQRQRVRSLAVRDLRMTIDPASTDVEYSISGACNH